MRFLKFLLTLAVIALGILGARSYFNIPNPLSTTASQPVALSQIYRLADGEYQLAGPFLDPQGNKSQQVVVVQVSNKAGEVQITPRILFGGAVPIVGTLDENKFTGFINDFGGRVEIEGVLTGNNILEGKFYEENGTLIGPFRLSQQP